MREIFTGYYTGSIDASEPNTRVAADKTPLEPPNKNRPPRKRGDRCIKTLSRRQQRQCDGAMNIITMFTPLVEYPKAPNQCRLDEVSSGATLR